MSEPIFAIRTPLGEAGGMLYGGPLRIRAGRETLYAGFASREVAMRAVEHWGMDPGRVRIEPWHQARERDAPDGRPVRMLVFRSKGDFERYITAPGEFVAEAHVVRLHPGPAAAGV